MNLYRALHSRDRLAAGESIANYASIEFVLQRSTPEDPPSPNGDGGSSSGLEWDTVAILQIVEGQQVG